MSDDRTNDHDPNAEGSGSTPPWGETRDGQQPPANSQDGGFGQQPPAYGQQPPAYGQQPPQFGQQPSAYGGQQGAYGQQPPQFGGYGAPGGQQQFTTGGEPPLWAPWYGISFPNAFVRFWKKYVRFDGRASRSEYWWFFLWGIIVSFVLGVIGSFTQDGNGDSTVETTLSAIWGLATILPQLALQARRLHDTNRSGWWMLIGLIPIVGWIILIVWNASREKPEGARFDQPNR
jgi:uncharacterized membrane protein YhaH (DUF805 family)